MYAIAERANTLIALAQNSLALHSPHAVITSTAADILFRFTFFII